MGMLNFGGIPGMGRYCWAMHRTGGRWCCKPRMALVCVEPGHGIKGIRIQWPLPHRGFSLPSSPPLLLPSSTPWPSLVPLPPPTYLGQRASVVLLLHVRPLGRCTLPIGTLTAFGFTHCRKPFPHLFCQWELYSSGTHTVDQKPISGGSQSTQSSHTENIKE